MRRISLELRTMDDTAILRLIAHHNRDALEILYDRYGQLVYSIAVNIVSNHETAEKIVQDVFTRIWEEAQIDDAGQVNVSTWLVTNTRNRSIDELRRNKIRPDQNSIDWSDASDFTDHRDQIPESDVETRWRRQAIREAMAALTNDQQRVLALAYFRGYSHSEIAVALNEPVGSVKIRLCLAVQKLRQVLSGKDSTT